MSTVLKRSPIGFGQTVDSRIAPDVSWIEDTYKVRVTAGYAPTGHAAAGDHPLGLAIDVVPDTSKGGTWDNVDALAQYAAQHPGIFRFVGYDGRFGTTAWPGHGRGDHLHLSWHGGGTAGDTDPLKTITNGGSVVGGALKGAATGIRDMLLPGQAIVGAAGDALSGEAKKAAAGVAKDAVNAIWGAVGEDGARALLYALLVFGGIALAVVGVARATGVGQKVKTAAANAAKVAEVAAIA